MTQSQLERIVQWFTRCQDYRFLTWAKGNKRRLTRREKIARGYKLTGVKGWHGDYQRGDEAIEINYQARVRITGKHSCPGFYRIEGVGWDLPEWDNSAWECDLVPIKVQATTIGGDNREVW